MHQSQGFFLVPRPNQEQHIRPGRTHGHSDDGLGMFVDTSLAEL
jgi:hypothetical protein